MKKFLRTDRPAIAALIGFCSGILGAALMGAVYVLAQGVSVAYAVQEHWPLLVAWLVAIPLTLATCEYSRARGKSRGGGGTLGAVVLFACCVAVPTNDAQAIVRDAQAIVPYVPTPMHNYLLYDSPMCQGEGSFVASRSTVMTAGAGKSYREVSGLDAYTLMLRLGPCISVPPIDYDKLRTCEAVITGVSAAVGTYTGFSIASVAVQGAKLAGATARATVHVSAITSGGVAATTVYISFTASACLHYGFG